MINRRYWFKAMAAGGLAAAGLPVAGEAMGSGSGGATPLTSGVLFNAADYGARGDGKADATDGIQKALDAAARRGGGVVLLPAGQYRVGGSLHVPSAVALEGVFRGPVSHSGHALRARPHKTARAAKRLAPLGTLLLVTGGQGKEDAEPTITVAGNASLGGLTIYHPNQNPNAAPVEYPWAISMIGANATVSNVELLNSWRGIRAVKAPRHLIRNVTGQPLRTGILVDEIYDIGRIEDVHFNPWWSHHRSVLEFMYQHGESFVLGRSDWEYVLNTFSFGYGMAYRFIEGKTGACNGNFLGIGADGSRHACVVEQSQLPGLLITNGEFVSFDYLKLGKVDPVQVLVQPPNIGPVRFVNCSFWGPCRQIARLGSACTVGFGDCTFCQWDQSQYAIESLAGRLLVRGCEFQQKGSQVRLHQAVNQAVITGNIAMGAWQIANGIKRRAHIGLNGSGS
ncbi:MAG: glycosyl hydrolase family 28-related protein [Phycisphaerae bacterium]